MTPLDLLPILAAALLCYAAAPLAGAFAARRGWRIFRRRFDELRARPLLDYAASLRDSGGEDFRFAGAFESVSEDDAGGLTLWIRGGALTVPVDLTGAWTYALPDTQDDPGGRSLFDPGEEIPQRLRWDRVSALAGETRIFVGGPLITRDGRRIFASTPARPLLVIVYEGADRSLALRATRAGRDRNEFFNRLTPYAFILGIFCELVLALGFLNRPAYRTALAAALTAVFLPLFPWIPPGVFLTTACRRLWWRARLLRAYRDLARLPLAYLAAGRFPDGEPAVIRVVEELPPDTPRIIPGEEKRPGDRWRVFGTADGNPPADAFAPYGALPGEPRALARRWSWEAYLREIVAALLCVAGIVLNIAIAGWLVIALPR